jgi:hypothetical protein
MSRLVLRARSILDKGTDVLVFNDVHSGIERWLIGFKFIVKQSRALVVHCRKGPTSFGLLAANLDIDGHASSGDAAAKCDMTSLTFPTGTTFRAWEPAKTRPPLWLTDTGHTSASNAGPIGR